MDGKMVITGIERNLVSKMEGQSQNLESGLFLAEQDGAWSSITVASE
jgi:hypothetical protein